jgi:hypothetical protein
MNGIARVAGDPLERAMPADRVMEMPCKQAG